jgi:hypothetical protein
MPFRPSYRVAENFVRKFGYNALVILGSALNGGESLETIAGSLHLSVSRVSQIVSQIFCKRYVFSPGAQELIDFYLQNQERRIESQKKESESLSESSLTFIPGALHNA